MKELALKYGCNPNQKPSRIFMEEGELPLQVINGRPGYINFLDALNSWQLVTHGRHPSDKTLDRLALLAGFQNWKDLREAMRGESDAAFGFEEEKEKPRSSQP